MNKLKLLYVEDDHKIAVPYKEYFEEKGCEVLWVKYSLGALEQYDREQYDLVITDYNLLHGDTGIPVAEEALKRGIPVRVFSGADWWEERIESVKGIWIRKSYPEEIFAFIQGVYDKKFPKVA